MKTIIKSVTILNPQGVKTYKVGETYNGMDLNQIRDHSLETKSEVHVEYAGFTEDNKRVFQVINSPMDIQYERVDAEMHQWAECPNCLTRHNPLCECPQKFRDPLGQTESFTYEAPTWEIEKKRTLRKIVFEGIKHERQRCLQAIEKLQDGEKDIKQSAQYHTGYTSALREAHIATVDLGRL